MFHFKNKIAVNADPKILILQMTIFLESNFWTFENLENPLVTLVELKKKLIQINIILLIFCYQYIPYMLIKKVSRKKTIVFLFNSVMFLLFFPSIMCNNINLTIE